ncbi:MAG: hypothetical protein R2801_02140 [Chitinophagales bacterium]
MILVQAIYFNFIDESLRIKYYKLQDDSVYMIFRINDAEHIYINKEIDIDKKHLSYLISIRGFQTTLSRSTYIIDDHNINYRYYYNVSYNLIV